MTRLEVAEMRFLRSATGYTRLDKIRSEVIRNELEISGIQDVRLKYKENWINHLERMDDNRLPKQALNCKPRGRRDRGRPRKRRQCVDAGTGQTTSSIEEDDDDDDDFEKPSNITFHENPSSWSQLFHADGQDTHDEGNSRFSQFCERAKKKLCDISNTFLLNLITVMPS